MNHYGIMNRRSIGGLKAKRNGDDFENILMGETLKRGMGGFKIPEGCKRVRRNLLLQVRTPFDFTFYDGPLFIFCDAKHTTAMVYRKSLIKPHQVHSLLKLERETGHAAGYVIYFKPLNAVYFYKASALHELQANKSLKPEDGLLLGSRFDINLRLVFTRAHISGLEKLFSSIFEGLSKRRLPTSDIVI
jgi:hypothetical protein